MKFKQIPSDYFITILDRLTRFEPACVRYKRVFDDIINKFCLDEKLKNLSLEDEIKIVEEIFNSSIKQNNDFYINDILMGLEEKYFNFNQSSYQYLSARLNISSMVSEVKKNENLAKNVQWLIEISKSKTNILELRKKENLLYPIEKIILCEGQTEHTLLETIFKKLNYDINQNGVLILPAGGKNQVARKYYSMLEYVKLPFFILLDKDAMPIKDLIEPKLRPVDTIYLIKNGEIEDIIPQNILQKTINIVHKNELNCMFDDFDPDKSMVYNLENIYKKYGFGEFKKAKFAHELKEYIEFNTTLGDFKNSELVEIKNALK
ncbi:MAG: ATP-dependent endonuclease [Cyanobacteria bacterium SIG27]|nr:ATP-dependent endonuclease [Cyanobacteria bacterium SIG27]